MDRTLDRILGKRVDMGATADPLEGGDGADDHGCFGWLRGVRERAIMLELRKRDGRIKAFGYAWLESAEFDPSDGITLYFPGHVVRIRGKHLNAPLSAGGAQIGLFGGLLRHRIPWLGETSQQVTHLQPTREGAEIGAIEW